MRLFVGNVAWGIEEEELKEFFQDNGFAIESAQIMRDRETGKARGFGFVTLAEGESAQRVIEAMNGQRLKGRPLTVNTATPRAAGARR